MESTTNHSIGAKSNARGRMAFTCPQSVEQAAIDLEYKEVILQYR